VQIILQQALSKERPSGRREVSGGTGAWFWRMPRLLDTSSIMLVSASLWLHRQMLALALVQVLLVGAAEVAKPWPLKLIIDHVLGGQPLRWPLASGWSRETLLWAACMSLITLYLMLGGLHLLGNAIDVRLGQGLVNHLRDRLYRHLQQLSLTFHQRRQSADLLHRLTADTQAIQTVVMQGLIPLLTAMVLFVGMTVVMLRLDGTLTLLALSVCPLLLIMLGVLSPAIGQAARVTRERSSAIYALVQHAMAAIRVIQAYTMENAERQRLMTAQVHSRSAHLRLNNLLACYFGAVEVAIAIGTVLVVWCGARQVLAGMLSSGELLVFVTYLVSLYSSLHTMSRSIGLLGEARAALLRVHEVLSVSSEVTDGHRTLCATKPRGEIRFESVTFGYTPDQPVLRDVDLHIAPGQMVAIVGATGAGKSTLIGLLPRFYDPQHGRVLLDAIDVRQLTLGSLRQHIAMVLQPPVVFSMTVRENIAYGSPGASPNTIAQAARLARIHETIMRLPEGYETILGEQGATLSEGERQRLTLARAILRNAPILILDEPTSAVDAATESLIMEGLEQFAAGRTTFIIAHRLATIQRADVILVMQHGRIVEHGTFAQLMHREGAFTALYRSQFRR
jgi:ATP-binding cassette subfamily B protein